MRVILTNRNEAEFESGTVYMYRHRNWLFFEPLHYELHKYWLFEVKNPPLWLEALVEKLAAADYSQAEVLKTAWKAPTQTHKLALCRVLGPQEFVDDLIQKDYDYLSIVTPQFAGMFVVDCFFFMKDADVYMVCLAVEDCVTDDSVVVAIAQGEDSFVHRVKVEKLFETEVE